MKNLVKTTLILSLSAFLFSCNQGKIDELEAQKTELQNKLTEEKEKSALKDSTITDFFDAIAEIESNLEQVRTKENQLGKMSSNGDVKNDSKEQIINDITLISELLGENKKTIKRLNEMLSKSNINSSRLKESIASLELRVNNKDEQITKLTNNLSNANTALSALNQIYISKVKEAEEMDEQLHTAYYAFGTFKELKNNNVLSKEGSIIGIGGAKTLTDNFNRDYFKKINTLAIKSLPLYTDKDVEIATEHPAESYEISEIDGVNVLLIDDSELFWSVSKYLVIITK